MILSILEEIGGSLFALAVLVGVGRAVAVVAAGNTCNGGGKEMKRDWVLHYPRERWQRCFAITGLLNKWHIYSPFNPLAWPAFVLLVILGCKLEVRR